MITIVVRCLDRKLFCDKLAEIGLPMIDDERGLRTAEAGEREFVPWLAPASGGFVATVRLTDEQWKLLPTVTSPDFLIDWDSETEELEWPHYTINGTDIEGQPTTWVQGAGVIG